MTSIQLFSWRNSSYLKTFTKNIFLGLESVFVKSKILDCTPAMREKKGAVLDRFFFRILDYSFLSELFQESICSGAFSPIIGDLKSSSFIKRELHCIRLEIKLFKIQNFRFIVYNL